MKFNRNTIECRKNYGNIVFKQRYCEYIDNKVIDKYKTRHLLIRDNEKSFEEFISKVDREKARLKALGLDVVARDKPINYIEAYPDQTVDKSSEAIIETVNALAKESSKVPT